MRVALIALTLLAATASRARADGFYLHEGFGTTGTGGEMGQYFDGGATIRLALGHRSGRWAIEGYLKGHFLDGTGFLGDKLAILTTYGISARHFYHLSKSWRAFLRGGFGRAELSGGFHDDYRIGDYGGRSLHYGGGIQASGKLRALGFLWWPLFFAKIGPKVSASLSFELDRQITRLHHPTGPSLDGRFTTWMMAFTLGGDF